MASAKNVTSRVVSYMKKNIRDGIWPVGSKIPSEHELCRELGVSRISVRSALQQFIALNILQSQHGKGTFVLSDDLGVFGYGLSSDKNFSDMKQMLEFRLLIEPEICSVVAQQITPETLDRLSLLLDQMKSEIGQGESFVRSDMDFHQEICDAMNNAVLKTVMSDVLKRKSERHIQLNNAVGYYGGIYYHTLLLDALQKHDGKRAHGIMREHLQKGIEDLEIGNEDGSV